MRTNEFFFDSLAQYLVRFAARILTGDFNTALFSVIPELRARGFQINFAAWYCWGIAAAPDDVNADSCGIFVIGPFKGIRLIFDCTVFGMAAPTRTDADSMVMEILRGENKKKIARRPYPVPKLGFSGQGYPLTSYRPEQTTRREKFVQWTFVPVSDQNSSAVAELQRSMKTDSGMFLRPIATATGVSSWTWPPFPPSKQKLVDFDEFDPGGSFSRAGALMPLMTYIGEKNDTRIIRNSIIRRGRNADARGWHAERKANFPFPKEEGKGQEGKKPSTRGGGAASGSQGKGGWGWSATAAWDWSAPAWDWSAPADWSWSGKGRRWSWA